MPVHSQPTFLQKVAVRTWFHPRVFSAETVCRRAVTCRVCSLPLWLCKPFLPQRRNENGPPAAPSAAVPLEKGGARERQNGPPPKTQRQRFWVGKEEQGSGRSFRPQGGNGGKRTLRRRRATSRKPALQRTLRRRRPPGAHFLCQQKVGKEWPKGGPFGNPRTVVPFPAVGRPHASASSAHFSPKSGCTDVVPPTILTGCYFPASRCYTFRLFVSSEIM